MAKSKKQFAEKLEAITRQFAGKVGAKIDEIETASERLFNADTEKETADALDALFLPVHRISGSAGSFGFPSLSETAASLEGMLRAIKDGSRRPSAEELGQVSVLLKRLRRNAATPPDGAAPSRRSLLRTRVRVFVPARRSSFLWSRAMLNWPKIWPRN